MNISHLHDEFKAEVPAAVKPHTLLVSAGGAEAMRVYCTPLVKASFQVWAGPGAVLPARSVAVTCGNYCMGRWRGGGKSDRIWSGRISYAYVLTHQ